MTRLIELLRLSMPSRQETSLLRACLLQDEEAGVGWRSWVAAVGDPRSAIAGRPELKLLLPLLQDALSKARIDAGELTSYLRIAAVRERHRARALASVLEEIASLLSRAGIRPTLTGGLALAITAYADPGLRHCHDIDLLLDCDELGHAVTLLAEAGFTVEDQGVSDADGTRRAIARTGLPVVLYPVIAQRSIRVDSSAWLTTTPERLLLRILSQATDGGSRRLLRIADAAVLLRSTSPSFDWELVAACTTAQAWSLRALATLSTLDGIIEQLVPPAVLRELEHRSRRASTAERASVLASLRRRGELAAPTLWRHATWRSRLDLVRFELGRAGRTCTRSMSSARRPSPSR